MYIDALRAHSIPSGNNFASNSFVRCYALMRNMVVARYSATVATLPPNPNRHNAHTELCVMAQTTRNDDDETSTTKRGFVVSEAGGFERQQPTTPTTIMMMSAAQTMCVGCACTHKEAINIILRNISTKAHSHV